MRKGKSNGASNGHHNGHAVKLKPSRAAVRRAIADCRAIGERIRCGDLSSNAYTGEVIVKRVGKGRMVTQSLPKKEQPMKISLSKKKKKKGKKTKQEKPKVIFCAIDAVD